nr:gustatory receptor [Semanotus bifasciatus]
MVFLVILILSCDSAEKTGQNIIKTCYLLHQSAKGKLIRLQLLDLARYAEQWRPIFSAAGFYNINQRTLSSVFDTIINYLVILLQLNLALEYS